MPKIYLSPSTQESNPYITGSGSEEYNMNRLADALEPYLYANGIRFVRNTPDMTAASSIAQANRLGGFDFYLALHSNAAAPESSGSVRGVLVFYYPTSAEGKRAADLFAANLKRVYPLPDLVRTVPTTALGEVRQPKYPANLLELGYHDNYADAAWVETNMDAIAAAPARLPERRGADHRAHAERCVGHGLRHLAGLEHGRVQWEPRLRRRGVYRELTGSRECRFLIGQCGNTPQERPSGNRSRPDRFRKNKHTAPEDPVEIWGRGVKGLAPCVLLGFQRGDSLRKRITPLTKAVRRAADPACFFDK